VPVATATAVHVLVPLGYVDRSETSDSSSPVDTVVWAPPPSTTLPAAHDTLTETVSPRLSVEKLTVVELVTSVAPDGPAGPCGPVGPCAPVTPCGPVGPVSPCGPAGPCGPVAPVSP
jgi:hypothetical protein